MLHPYAVVFQNQALFGIPMAGQWERSPPGVGNKLFFFPPNFIYPSLARERERQTVGGGQRERLNLEQTSH